MATFSFDATQVAPQESLSPVPAGTYIGQIEETEIKETRSRTGEMIKYKFRILDGQYKNRVIFGNFNIRNQNPEAERIGQSQFSALCHAAGVLKVSDTAQLHGRPVKAKVKIRKDEQYGDSNDISAFEPVGDAAVPTTSALSSAPSAAPSAATPPWQKRAA